MIIIAIIHANGHAGCDSPLEVDENATVASSVLRAETSAAATCRV